MCFKRSLRLFLTSTQKYRANILSGIAVLALSFPFMGNAETLKNNSDEWEFKVAPYIWAAGIHGDVGHSRIGRHFVKSSFSDILKKVDLSAMIMGEARKGDYSVLLDLMYIDSSVHYTLPAKVPATDFKARGKILTGFAGMGYTFWENERASLDLVGGLRAWHTDVTLGLYRNSAQLVTAKSRETWIDATAGLRGHFKINDQFSMTAWGLAGKGGANLDWDASLLANWKISRDFTLTAGYRAIHVDYKKRGFVYDITQKGPMIGVSYHF